MPIYLDRLFIFKDLYNLKYNLYSGRERRRPAPEESHALV